MCSRSEATLGSSLSLLPRSSPSPGRNWLRSRPCSRSELLPRTGSVGARGPLETSVNTGHDFYFQCAALLSVALEQEGTVVPCAPARSATPSPRVPPTTALGLDLLDGRVMLSDRWKAVVGCKSDEVGTSPGEWLGRYIRDRAALDEGLHACTSGQSTALESEHRLRSSDAPTAGCTAAHWRSLALQHRRRAWSVRSLISPCAAILRNSYVTRHFTTL